MRIFLTGGTGFLGRHLVPQLTSRGHEVTLLTRRMYAASPGVTALQGDPAQSGAWQAAVAGHDAVINLAGEPLSRRWTAARKHDILRSRVETTRHLVSAMQAAATPPQCLIQASAIGGYGPCGEQWLTEEAPFGSGFLADVTRAWEAAAAPAEAAGIRTVRLRIGIVLGRDGGALPRLMAPFRYGFGTPLGSGRQYYSWIHIDDWVRLVLFCLEQPVRGPLNAVAPQPVSMREFGRTLAGVMLRPYWPVAVPAFVLRALLGEMATVVVDGQRVCPRRALDAGFTFRYPALDAALEHLILG